MDVDKRGHKRGECLVEDCDCEKFEKHEDSANCEYCGDPPTRHKKLSKSRVRGAKLTAIIDIDCRGKRRGHCKIKECDCEQFETQDTAKACGYCFDPPAKHEQVQLHLKVEQIKMSPEQLQPKVETKEENKDVFVKARPQRKVKSTRKRKKKMKPAKKVKPESVLALVEMSAPMELGVIYKDDIEDDIYDGDTLDNNDDDGGGGSDWCPDIEDEVSNASDHEVDADKTFTLKKKDKKKKTKTSVKTEHKDPAYIPDDDEELFHSCKICDCRFKSSKALQTHVRCHDNKSSPIKTKLYTCDICGNMYRQRKSLRDHKEIHLGLTEYICDICGKKFNRRSTRNRHKRIHNENYLKYKCGGCGEKFHKVSELREHVQKTGERPYECILCGANFGIKDCYKAHMITHEEKNFQCTLCSRKFRKPSALKFHMMRHSGDVKFTCEFCGKQFASKYNLKLHVLSHQGVKLFKCKQCDKSYSTAKSLRTHMFVHTKVMPFECSICHKVFRYIAVLKQHEVTHSSERIHECPDCDARFSTKDCLDAHSKTHYEENKLYVYKFLCKHCDKKFASETLLKLHELKHSGENENPLQCHICLKVFKLPNVLKTHIDIVHNQIRKHQCHECGKKFGYSGHLALHLRRHTGEKPYQCNFCEKKFSGKAGLDRHTKIHTGEKPFVCEFCGKAFPEVGDLRSHRRAHTGEKPFVCKICGKSCTRRDNLRTHEKIHYKNGSLQTTVSGRKGLSKASTDFESSATNNQTLSSSVLPDRSETVSAVENIVKEIGSCDNSSDEKHKRFIVNPCMSNSLDLTTNITVGNNFVARDPNFFHASSSPRPNINTFSNQSVYGSLVGGAHSTTALFDKQTQPPLPAVKSYQNQVIEIGELNSYQPDHYKSTVTYDEKPPLVPTVLEFVTDHSDH